MKRIFLIILLVAASWRLQAQWGFSIRQGQRGNCSGCDNIQITVVNFGTIPLSGFATRQECEAARQSLSGISQTFVCGCTLYVICTSCTGSDIVIAQQVMPGDVSVMGTERGEPFLTTDQSRAISDWINDYLQLMKSMGFGNASDFLFLLTGNNTFDKAYDDGVVAFIGKSRTPIDKDPSELKLNPMPKVPSVGESTYDINKGKQKTDAMQQMKDALAELSRIDRLCESKQFDCKSFDKERDKANNLLKDAETKLKDLRKDEYLTEKSKCERQKEMYEQQKKDCSNKLCEEAMDKGIAEMNERINKADRNIRSDDTYYTYSTKKDIKEGQPEMSFAEKQCEIGYEMIERGDKVGGQKLLDQYAPIVATHDAYVYVEDKANIVKDAVKEEIGTMKDMLTGKYMDDEDVEKYSSRAGADIYGIVGSFMPDGPAQVFDMINKAVYQDGNINTGEIGKDMMRERIKDYPVDKAIEFAEKKFLQNIPILSTSKRVYDTRERISKLFENIKTTYDYVKYNRELDKQNK